MNIKSNVISLLIAASVGSSAAFVSNGASNVQTKLFAEEDFNLDIGNTEPAFLGDRRNLFKAAGALATANALLPNIASAEIPSALQTASSLKLPKMGLVRAYSYVLCLLFVGF